MKLECRDSKLKIFYGKDKKARKKMLNGNPGYWNLAGYEKEWRSAPEYCDYLSVKSPKYKEKKFQQEIYMSLMEKYVKRLPAGGKVLDAGGGIGRFALKFARRGFEVHLMDVSVNALKAANRHFSEARLNRFHLYLADTARMDFFPSETFQCALAMELICYSNEPERIVQNLHRVLKKYGWLFLSVENKYGALLGDNNLSAEEILSAIKDDEVRIENYLYVKYYNKKELREMLERCGFKVASIVGCQYTVDGIFDRLARNILEETGSDKTLRKLEKICREDSLLKNFPRAWLAIGRKQ